MYNFISVILNQIVSFAQNFISEFLRGLAQSGVASPDMLSALNAVFGVVADLGYAVIFILTIVLHIIISKKISAVAIEKGHADKKPMLWCILGGVAGYAYVASLPDLKARPATETVEEKAEAEAKEEEAPASDAE